MYILYTLYIYCMYTLFGPNILYILNILYIYDFGPNWDSFFLLDQTTDMAFVGSMFK